MAEESDWPVSEEAAPSPGLVVVTGASHTGKTSVSRALLPLLDAPVAWLGVDGTLDHVLVRPTADPWQEIPLAYDLLETQIDILLGRSWTVVLESTFTYVPEQGPPEFHHHAIRAMVAIAERRGVRHLVAHLTLDSTDAMRRAEDSGRLSPEIVAQTVALHEAAAMPAPSIKLSTQSANPEELALATLAAFRRL
ncbi:MAG: AAA family ATPase [Solirubrobacterales bacterium]